MDLQTTIKASSVIGAVYASNCIFMTDKYLEDQGVEVNSNTKYITRGLAGGVIGLTVSTILAGFNSNSSKETLDVIAKAHVASFSFWLSSSLYQITQTKHEKETPVGPKVDAGICAAMLTLFATSLLKSD